MPSLRQVSSTVNTEGSNRTGGYACRAVSDKWHLTVTKSDLYGITRANVDRRTTLVSGGDGGFILVSQFHDRCFSSMFISYRQRGQVEYPTISIWV